MQDITQILIHYKDNIGIIISGFAGAITHILNRVRKGEEVSLFSTLFHLSASGFVGYLVFLLCGEFGITGGYMGAMVGMSGYAGAKILDIIDSISPKAISDLLLDFVRYKLGAKK